MAPFLDRRAIVEKIVGILIEHSGNLIYLYVASPGDQIDLTISGGQGGGISIPAPESGVLLIYVDILPEPGAVTSGGLGAQVVPRAAAENHRNREAVMRASATRDAELDRQAGIIAWFVALVHAHFRQEHRKAAEAMDVLENLGISVRFRSERKRADRQGVQHGQ